MHGATHFTAGMAAGAPVFWPFGRTTLAHIKTGSNMDKLVGGAFLVLAAVVAVLPYV